MSDKPLATPKLKAKTQPQPTALTQPFWDAAAKQQLMLQVSTTTGRAQFFPRPHGIESAEAVEWKAASGQGELIAFTVSRVPAPGYEGEAPYVMGIVRLAEGPRVLAQIINAEPAALKAGLPVQLAWDITRPGLPAYLFQPAK